MNWIDSELHNLKKKKVSLDVSSYVMQGFL